MDITKQDSKMIKGVAILSMLMLHLFCRTDNLPYTPLIWLAGKPLIYYFGQFGDICVFLYCFVSGYAHYLKSSETELRHRWKHLLRFMILFWLIAVVFSLIGICTGNTTIPGSVTDFLLNCLTIKNSYNGAWWYANTYILLVALQPISYRFVKHCPSGVVLSTGFVFYIIGYGIRFWGWGECNSALLAWVITHIALLGTSYLGYAIGMLFCKKQVIAFLRQKISAIDLCIIFILTIALFAGMLFVHGIVPSAFVSFFTATATVVLLCISPLPTWLTRLLCYFGDHSTNIWLVHMFYYSVLFEDFVFCAQYPILVFLLLLAVSLASSYIIRLISKPILKHV